MVAGIVFILLWEFEVFHKIFNLAQYQLPLPSSIFETLISNGEVLLSYSLYTLQEAVYGIVIGSLIGFFVALIATFFPKWGYGGLFIIIGLNAVPIIALAPIMNLWFGSGLASRVAVVSVTTMAGMAIGAYKGFNELPRHSLDLMKSYAASKGTVFLSLRLPNSLPYLLTALKINTTAGMIGAILSEFFYSSKGLGYMLSNSIKIAKMSMGWSCIVLAAILGILLYVFVSQIEKYAVKWHASQRLHK